MSNISNAEFLNNIVLGLNDSQKKAVLNPVETCTKIVAGAGTGKTKIISKRFVKLVLDLMAQGETNPQSKILVITFTDKAANEMKARILAELEDNNIDTLAQELWISTFHGFCIKILKKYAIEAGFSPSFKMAEEAQLQKIYDNLIKRIKYGEETGILSIQNVSKLNKINDVEKILEDVFGVIKKVKSLGITAEEFEQRSIEAIKGFTNTARNTPFKFDSKETYTEAWAEHFRLYTDDSARLDEKIFDAIAKDKLILDKNGKRKASEYGMAQGFPENLPEIEETEILLTKIIAAIYDKYQKELEKHDLADFDDLINKTIQIFKENEFVRAYFQKHFKQVIVDEFQDTNGAQLELIELLLNPEYPDLTYVGDRKQSIYAFRYAQTENLEVLHKYVEVKYGKHFEPINLSINYRSTPEVLRAVNYVTENELKLDGENLTHNPNLNYADSLKDVRVTLVDGFENAYEQKIAEAKYIAEEILNLKERDNADFKDFAVLVKSHSQADIVEKELKLKGIPSVKKVNTGFFKEPVIKNFFAALRLIKNPEDEIALFRLLKIRLSDAEIYEIRSAARDFPWVHTITDCLNYIRKNKGSMTLGQIFEKVKNEIILNGIFAPMSFEQAINNLKILEKIIDDYTQNGGYISVPGLFDYLEKIKEDRSFELPNLISKEINAVQIMTIHASKGLEFPYVFVLSITTASKTVDKTNVHFDMQFGSKPGFGIVVSKFKGKPNPKALLYKQLWQKPRDKSEALRLFYVAVSRAAKYLNVLSFEPYSVVKPAEYVDNLGQFLV